MPPMVMPNPPADMKSPFADCQGHHVAIRVADFEASKRWYQETLDFRLVFEWPSGDRRMAYLAPPNDDHFWVELLGDGSPAPKERPYSDLGESLHCAGYHHFCLSVADIDATVAELKRRSVNMVAGPFQLDVIGRKLAFFADPSGNLIELAQPV